MTYHLSVRTKSIIALLLALLAAGIALTDRLMGVPVGLPSGRRSVTPAEEQEIRGVLDTLLVQYGIERRGVISWHVQIRGIKWTRLEERVSVPPSFLSVRFNHDLNERLAALGAHVVGTERTKENAVILHIVKSHATIWSIAFVTDPDL